MKLELRAAFAPSSVNEAERTADVIFSTGAPVQRRDMEGGFMEHLSLDPAHAHVANLVGRNVLDTHRQGGLANILGVVLDARTDGTQGSATIQFSRRPEVDPIFADVQAGVIRHVSVGYTVKAWQDGTDPATGARTRTAIDWTPHELSFVSVPADPGRDRKE